MSFSEDPTIYFDTDGFAVTANYDSGTIINGIFSDEYVDVHDVEGTRPVFRCAASSVSGIAHDKTLVIDSTTYTVKGVQQDETGNFLTLVLSE